MLRWIVLALVVIALTATATFLSQYAPNSETGTVAAVTITPGPKPKVEVPGPLTHEFGSMAQLSVGKHTWEFKNVGEADLVLWLDGSTCSCTIAKLKSEDGKAKPTVSVKPNESTTIDLEWETKVFHDEYKKGATIGTNDPTRPTVSLHVHGMVYPPVIVFPKDVIMFNSVSNDELHEAKIAVFSVDRPDLKITKLTTSRPEFLVPRLQRLTAEECKQLKVKAGYQVSVEMKQGMPLGRFADELFIQTDHPLNSDVKMPIIGVVTGPISVIPSKVSMPSVSSRDGATQDWTLLVQGGKPTKFTVAYKPEKVRVEIEPDDTPTQKGRYKMYVIVPPGTSAGHVEDQIILETDHPKVHQMKIPVSIFILNADSG